LNDSLGKGAIRLRRPLVIAGTASGAGKTAVATGIMAALTRRGLKVAPFKVGPDYIDPGYHQAATGRVPRNLDTWLRDDAGMRENFLRGAAEADVSIIEGVMGLFDGRAGAGNAGSTAEAAFLLEGALVLVVDCARMSRSLAALLHGFATFDPAARLAGVILNNTGSDRHRAMLADAAAEAGVPVLGAIPRRPELKMESRHLGLVAAAETECGELIDSLAAAVEEGVDLERLLALAETLDCAWSDGAAAGAQRSAPRVTLAVARDEAFSFYYADALEALEAAGAAIVYFSPLRDGELPDCDGVYLGGGYPEVFAAGLEENAAMRASLAGAAAAGMPVYAECGGLVYLCRSLETDGRERSMAGVLPLQARMTGRRQALGYVEATARRDSILFRQGETARGHEFHWSQVDCPADSAAWDCSSARAGGARLEGFAAGNVLASYVHINFAGNPAAARRFIEACREAKGALTGAA